MALLERADADAGGLEFGAGEEHEFAETGAQVAFWRDFRAGFCAHDADLVSGPGEIGKRLAGLVDGRRNHLRAQARRKDESEGEACGAKDKAAKLTVCGNGHGAGTSGGADREWLNRRAIKALARGQGPHPRGTSPGNIIVQPGLAIRWRMGWGDGNHGQACLSGPTLPHRSGTFACEEGVAR
jgi:hypothetical protein